ncbi:MAG: DNA primase [Candidatus Omnitrophota bacterium]
MIPQQFIEEVQTRTDIVELVSSYVPLKRAGRNFRAVCPFHGEKTPSFMVSPQKQIFHCFGCGEGGGIFQFLTLIEKVTFPEAVEILAKKLGMEVPEQRGQLNKEKTILYEAMDKAALFFHNSLKNNKEILAYLNKRGIAEVTIGKFLIGYAPGGVSLLNHMRKLGFTLDILEKVSLAVSIKGDFRDVFYGRIVFPIFDLRGRIVGFGARTYKDKPNSPKYINSLENTLYSKRNHLFGLNFSKEDITKQAAIIITEGYLDMITPFMRGVKNIAASLGTALTVEQIKLIKRYAACVILMYDSDKAGQAAALRSIDLLLENGLKVEVVGLPAGSDPDSLARENGKDHFIKFVQARENFFEYKLRILKQAYDSASIEGKTKIAKEMLGTINKLNSEVEKYEYIKKLSSSLGVREEIMIAEFRGTFFKSKAFPGKRSISGKAGLAVSKGSLTITEKVIFKFMFTSPKAFALIKKNLKEDYFDSTLARRTVSFFFDTYTNVNCFNPKLLGIIGDKEISGFVSMILMDDSIPFDKDTFKQSLLKLRKKGAAQKKNKLKEQIQEAETKGDRSRLKELIGEYGKVNLF